MVSTEVTPKSFASLTNFKSEFISNYQSSYPDQKSKTKAKLSNFKPSSKLSTTGGNINNCLPPLNACPQAEININVQENISIKEDPPIKLDIKCNFKNCSIRPEPSSTFVFFNECEKISKHNYSGSDSAKNIKAQIQSGFPWKVVDNNRACLAKDEDRQPWMRKKILEIKHESLNLTKDFDLSGLTLDD